MSPGNCCILKPRNLLYCASNQYALLCGAFRINFCNQLKAALPCRNCVPYPISLRSAGSDRPLGSRLHRSKSSCAYSPSLIVLCFGLIIVPCSRCAFQHAGGTHSRRTAKSAGGFSGDPRKNLPCLITVNQPRFSFSSVSIWASVFWSRL